MIIKNSNKILILILALTVSIPLLVAAVYMHKIKTDDFEYERPTARMEYPELNMQGSLDGVKVVKLIGSNYAALLGATILHSDLDNYVAKRENPSDSLIINRKGDTLIFKYFSTADLQYEYQQNHRIMLRLNLAHNIPVYAESCHLGWGSASDQAHGKGKLSSAEFYLSRDALLELGTQVMVFKTAPDTFHLRTEGQRVFVRDSSEATADSLNAIYANIGNVRIHADKSTVEIMQPLIFDSLGLSLNNGSTLKLNHPFKTKALQADVDPKTQIVGDFKTIQTSWPIIK